MTVATQTALGKMLEFIQRLDEQKVWYRIESIREETLMVLVAVPGEYWEVEFFEDGSVEVERFVSTGRIEGEELFDRLFNELAV